MPIIDTTKDLAALFRAQVRLTPNLVALEDGTTILTYLELDSRVSTLAHRLRHLGVGRDSQVGVLLGRSAEYVIACLAALVAGGAFLVLELAYPPGLLADVVRDAKPQVIVTNTDYAGRFQGDTPLILTDQKHVPQEVSEHSLPPPPAEDDLDRLAFVSYSSGTTGTPKGIANPHRAPVFSYNLRFHVSNLTVGDRVACNVFFVWEILRPLLRGATVVTVPDDASYDPTVLVDLLASKKVTETLMTPTLLSAVLSRHRNIEERLPDLRTLWLNGEVVSTDLAQRALKALPKIRLLNCYSASETHEIACGDIREMLDDQSPYCPVGPSVVPDHTYILNDKGEKVVPGESGELYIGGSLLARGYLNRPETTANAFLRDPFDSLPGARMYKTGDVARILASGYLEITGRVGAMLKIRGYSIVPGKVESTIVGLLGVSQCVVTAYGDGLEKQLVAYLVRDKESTAERAFPTIDDSGYSPSARKALSGSLAPYMIPAVWMEMNEIPTHEVSGKADFKRLPSPRKPSLEAVTNGKHGTGAKAIVIPSIEVITEMWATILNTAPSSVTKEHDFFDMGGHSLTLANLATKMTRTFGHSIPLAQLAANPTLEGHLRVVQAARDGQVAAVQADLPAVLGADSQLEEGIKPFNTKYRPLSEAQTVLLTGATGFLGGFLLKDLIETTQAKIICLVRFNDPSESDYSAGMARIRKNLLDRGLWNDSITERITILSGHMSRKRLGLSIDQFNQLGSVVQFIIHAAATVNLVYPYALLRGANVDGTREIIRLASTSGASLLYISTNGILPPSQQGWTEDVRLSVAEVPTKIPDGYGQTKWAAEELVHEARKHQLPVRIIRLGTISGHSQTGSSNSYDLLTAIIVESLHLGVAPAVKGWRAEMTPVDSITRGILQIANKTDIPAGLATFHLGDANPIDTSVVFDHLQELSFPTNRLDWDQWVELWYEKRGHAASGNVFTADILRGGMPTVDFLRDITVLNDAKTREIVEDLPKSRIDRMLLEVYARHWYSRGWLPHPPLCKSGSTLTSASSDVVTKKGPLSGKVAVVTGGSSGIGAAIALALANEGASVALAARRVDSLKSIQSQIEELGGKAIAIETDVTSHAQVFGLMQETKDSLGPVDILVICAGVMYYTMMANAHIDQWNQTIDVNCKGLLNCLATTVPPMLERGKGHIVAISSDAGRKVFPGLGVYSASKFFVEATLQSLRLETAGKGLRVTSVQPGNVATNLLNLSTDQEAMKKYGEASGAKVLNPQDVADAVVYAVKQPDYVAVNEILIEPRDEPI